MRDSIASRPTRSWQCQAFIAPGRRLPNSADPSLRKTFGFHGIAFSIRSASPNSMVDSEERWPLQRITPSRIAILRWPLRVDMSGNSHTLNWHRRYLQQASWTSDLRAYLFEQARLSAARRVLEVGCGTGAILRDLAVPDSDSSPEGPSTSRFTFGLDRDVGALAECHRHAPSALLARADVVALPYADQAFDITCCHFFLLWAPDPLAALREMKRVTRKNGYVLALAEPDYLGRIDQPQSLAALGKIQNESLRRQGADVALGAHLADMFSRAGLNITETGRIQPLTQSARDAEPDDLEWQLLRADVAAQLSTQETNKLELLDAEARQRGERVLFVPTYFASGQV